MSDSAPPLEFARPTDFIRELVTEDLRAGRHGGRVHTRFPPEPNGYLHIGHAKSICLNFGVASEFRGLCNLRFDDTNPAKEDVEYGTRSRMTPLARLRLGRRPVFYASDYFEHVRAAEAHRGGHAYVDSLTADQIARYRGTLTSPGAQPASRASGCRNLTFPSNAGAASKRTARTRLARRSTWRRQHNMRDPTLRIRRAHAPPHRRRLVHLSDLRLRAPDLGRIEGITHSDLHARVRDPSAAVDWSWPRPRRGTHDGDPQQVMFARLN